MPTVAATSSTSNSMAMVMLTTITESSPIVALGRTFDRSLNSALTDHTSALEDNQYLGDHTTMLNDILDSSEMDILSQQQATAGASSLYSIEEISRWATTDCTALIHALLASFSVILVSELGDKTFIITAIMAMKNSRSLVFIASAMALLSMTILSVGMGVAVTVIPKLYTHYGSIILFLCFGLKMLKEAYDMGTNCDSDGSEFDEVKRSLEVQDCGNSTKEVTVISSDSFNQNTSMQTSLKIDCDESKTLAGQQVSIVEKEKDKISSETKLSVNDAVPELSSGLNKTLYIAPVIIKVFTMVFIAEWGDRSQISTVILAAREDVAGVFIGSLSGHLLCTGLAVIGGRFVAEMISVRTMTLLGGIIFLAFATFAMVTGPDA